MKEKERGMEETGYVYEGESMSHLLIHFSGGYNNKDWPTHPGLLNRYRDPSTWTIFQCFS